MHVHGTGAVWLYIQLAPWRYSTDTFGVGVWLGFRDKHYTAVVFGFGKWQFFGWAKWQGINKEYLDAKKRMSSSYELADDGAMQG